MALGASVLVLLVGRRRAATLRHRLTADGAILLIGDRVDLDVVPVGPVDQGLDLGRGGVHTLGVDVEVDCDRPGHALLAPVNVGGGDRTRTVVGQLVADALRVPCRLAFAQVKPLAEGDRQLRRRKCMQAFRPLCG